ncbi:MAG: Stk1 family PASTA domain-containing Ser/Thr kinase [Lachnospiraceae bacterium]|nr:Stk1 family PASTA domain-containing Ser/Thr kinase [Lachnospiraceae bacterium]
MIKSGMFISDRYEIIDKVGSGGMADVYKAKCHRLNRYVAIKILKPEFSSDANFVQKFRAEAQSVAGLSHPNIVSVYDVGDDDGLHYIVMELVEGITLKRFIERKGGLDVKEAVGIAIQIAQGMEAAHTHHIIHRDIKPQNIIISREGKVKVADFGIAKAATSNTISQNAMGSVHYLSPEQARGGYSDERSDIYSLGVTLYEMLTGQVPFAGDNSVSVALLHIQSEATPVQVLNPEVPTSVDRIVQKCMQKKPERRYQSAAELIRDLKRSILNPDGDYVNISSSAAVTNSPTRPMTNEEMESIKSAAKSPVVYYESRNSASSSDAYENRETSSSHRSSGRSSSRRDEEPRPNAKHIRKEAEEIDSMNSTLEKILAIVSIIFAVSLVFIIFYFLKKYFFNPDNEQGNIINTVTEIPTPTTSKISTIPEATATPTPPPFDPLADTFSMPYVIGYTVSDALNLLNKYSTNLTIDYSNEEFSEEIDKGKVSAQYPTDGMLVSKDGNIRLTVSAGKELIDLIDVKNRDFASAKSLLEAYNLKVIELHEYSNEIESGKVIRTEPDAPARVEKGSEVTVYVSDGEETISVSVPLITGMKVKSAKKNLAANGLEPGEETAAYSDTVESGLIISQSIPEGTLVDSGTTVDYVVSLGPGTGETEPTSVPDEPTATPVPETEQEPTEEPEPTEAPEPTEEPVPTATPEPTAEPEPTATPVPDDGETPVG